MTWEDQMVELLGIFLSFLSLTLLRAGSPHLAEGAERFRFSRQSFRFHCKINVDVGNYATHPFYAMYRCGEE